MRTRIECAPSSKKRDNESRLEPKENARGAQGAEGAHLRRARCSACGVHRNMGKSQSLAESKARGTSCRNPPTQRGMSGQPFEGHPNGPSSSEATSIRFQMEAGSMAVSIFSRALRSSAVLMRNTRAIRRSPSGSSIGLTRREPASA
jgi:hypothetical protein